MKSLSHVSAGTDLGGRIVVSWHHFGRSGGDMNAMMKHGLNVVKHGLDIAGYAMIWPGCRFEIMSRLALECGVAGFQVQGDYGLIESAANDTLLLKEYAKTGRWAQRTNDLLRSFFADGW
jgi:hypothetical protein